MFDGLHSNVQVRTHDSIYDDRTLSFDEAVKDLFTPDLLENGLIASDMDDTMFVGDLGIKAFVRKLDSPGFWNRSPAEFKKLVLPKSYRTILNLGAQGFVVEKVDQGLSLDAGICQLFLDLVEDVSDLYESVYKTATSNEMNIKNPLVGEFALKLYLIDQLTLQNDPIFRYGTGGQILMRTRYLLGRRGIDIEEITSDMMRVGQNDEDRMINLSLGSQNRGLVGMDRLSDYLDDEGVLGIDQYVGPVEGVRNIIMGLFNDASGLPVHVVTTNLYQIAQIALKNSKYAPLLTQTNFNEGVITASSLEHSDVHGTFGSKMVYPAVFGHVKRERLIGIQDSMRIKVILALGDSFSNDTPMMDLALDNGGVCVVVGDDYKTTRKKFDPFVQRAKERLNDGEIRKRVLYVEKDGQEAS